MNNIKKPNALWKASGWNKEVRLAPSNDIGPLESEKNSALRKSAFLTFTNRHYDNPSTQTDNGAKCRSN
ncbi:hypothetical protein [Paenibacillus sp. UNC496MF]|uniref:hypothetical protein n=1 Tax=Paenibacillus sp. UNC496MF TaxID=1502753 RepID=UPI003526CDFA